jgi:hypothetical protein
MRRLKAGVKCVTKAELWNANRGLYCHGLVASEFNSNDSDTCIQKIRRSRFDKHIVDDGRTARTLPLSTSSADR